MLSDSVQLQLAAIVHGVRYDSLPRDVVRHTKALILDSIGCMLGGVDSAPAIAVRRLAERVGGHPQASVVGTSQRTSAPLAVLANGTAVRYLDFNDYYTGHRDPAHPSGNLAVVLALAESEKRNGRDLIAALVAAYEVHLRLCDCAGEPNLWRRGWHHSTNAQFSSAAAAARLLGADVALIAQAIALAASHHNTLAQLQAGHISMMKATAEAWVAKGGVEAALLALCGVTGPADVIEGKSGWAAAVAGQVDYRELTAPLRDRYRILDASIKPFAVVGPATANVQAAIELHHAHTIRPQDIRRIGVQVPAFVLGTPSADPAKRIPENRETADHSYQYCAVIALLDGACSEAQFSDEKVRSPVVRSLLQRTDLIEDAEFTGHWPTAMGGGLAVELLDGTVLERRMVYQPGHPSSPLSEDRIARKFDALMPARFGGARAEAIKRAVAGLEECERIEDFMALLVP